MICFRLDDLLFVDPVVHLKASLLASIRPQAPTTIPTSPATAATTTTATKSTDIIEHHESASDDKSHRGRARHRSESSHLDRLVVHGRAPQLHTQLCRVKLLVTSRRVPTCAHVSALATLVVRLASASLLRQYSLVHRLCSQTFTSSN